MIPDMITSITERDRPVDQLGMRGGLDQQRSTCSRVTATSWPQSFWTMNGRLSQAGQIKRAREMVRSAMSGQTTSSCLGIVTKATQKNHISRIEVRHGHMGGNTT
jgi:hypothetical protein